MLKILTILAAAFIAPSAFAADTTQTIVFLRHGEKPDGGLGQLSCQGLNRALALPPVLVGKFGKPLALFAPAPLLQKDDDGQSYDYIRPLATIEPTAISLGMPVSADIGMKDRDGLQAALARPPFADGTVLVAWEHKQIEKIVRHIMKTYGGDASAVPKWKSEDFDSLYVVKLTRSTTSTTARFEQDHEGLDGQPTICPGQH